MEPTIIKLLSVVDMFGSISDHHLADYLLSHCKRSRKGESKEEIVRRGINIYKNQPIRVEEIIEKAINNKLLVVTDITERGRQLELSPDAILDLMVVWTKNWSPGYKSFSSKLRDILSIHRHPGLSEKQVAKLFNSGKTAAEAAAPYVQPRTSTRKIHRAYHEYVMKEFGGFLPAENEYVFHLCPKLFVPADLMGKKVSLQIDGVPVPPNLIVTTPFPNKRYYVCGMKKGRSRTSFGLYPLIGSQEYFPKSAKIRLRWIVDGTITIDHYMSLSFLFHSTSGTFFSTEQRFSVPIAIQKSFSLTTTIDTAGMGTERNAKIVVRDIGNHFEIHEEAALTNFPIDMHSGPAGVHFNKWFDEYRSGTAVV